MKMYLTENNFKEKQIQNFTEGDSALDIQQLMEK